MCRTLLALTSAPSEPVCAGSTRQHLRAVARRERCPPLCQRRRGDARLPSRPPVQLTLPSRPRKAGCTGARGAARARRARSTRGRGCALHSRILYAPTPRRSEDTRTAPGRSHAHARTRVLRTACRHSHAYMLGPACCRRRPLPSLEAPLPSLEALGTPSNLACTRATIRASERPRVHAERPSVWMHRVAPHPIPRRQRCLDLS